MKIFKNASVFFQGFMNILHLSDLHFGTESNTQTCYSQVAEDLSIGLKCKKIDSLIISGDIATFSRAEEYAEAEKFVNLLCSEFKVDLDQIIIVPGNHDLNWSLAKKAYKLVRHEENNNLEFCHKIGDYDEVRDSTLHKHRFNNFMDFYQAIKKVPYPSNYEEQAILTYLPQHRLLIMGLNSSWQLDHYDENSTGINPDALSHALDTIRKDSQKYETCLKFAVWHHPLNGDNSIKDIGFLQRLAQSGFCVALHGHIHKALAGNFRYDMSPGGRRIDIICAGTFGAPVRNWTSGYPLQYNFLRLEGNKLVVETRCRKEINGAWEPDALWLQGPGRDPLPRYEITLPDITNPNIVVKGQRSDRHPKPRDFSISAENNAQKPNIISTKKTRVYELANELKVNVHQIIKFAREEGIQLQNGLNMCTVEQAELIRNRYRAYGRITKEQTSQSLVGKATDIQLEESGEITAAKHDRSLFIDLDNILKRASYSSFVNISNDKAWLVTFHANRVIHLWWLVDLNRHIIIEPHNKEAGAPSSCAMRKLDNNGWELLIGFDEGVERWRISPHNKLDYVDWQKVNGLMQLTFSPDAEMLMILSLNKIEVWRANKQELIHSCYSEDRLRVGTFCDRFLVGGSEKGMTYIWELGKDYPIDKLDNHKGMPISSLIGIDKSQSLISAGENGSLVFIKLLQVPLKLRDILFDDAVMFAEYDKSSNTVFAALRDKSLHARDFFSSQDTWSISLPDIPSAISIVERSYLFIGNGARTIQILNIGTGQLLATLIGFKADGWLAYSENGDLVGERYESFVGGGTREFHLTNGFYLDKKSKFI